MSRTEPQAINWPVVLKAGSLVIGSCGFALELLAVILNSWILFKIGLFLFLLGLPSYLILQVFLRRAER